MDQAIAVGQFLFRISATRLLAKLYGVLANPGFRPTEPNIELCCPLEVCFGDSAYQEFNTRHYRGRLMAIPRNSIGRLCSICRKNPPSSQSVSRKGNDLQSDWEAITMTFSAANHRGSSCSLPSAADRLEVPFEVVS